MVKSNAALSFAVKFKAIVFVSKTATLI